MGKWIRERMRRRRKKTGDSKGPQAETLPPLQPNFMSGELPPRPPQPEPAPPQASAPEIIPDPAIAAKPETGAAAPQQRPQGRRRRRGRRGRGGRAPAPAAAPARSQPGFPETGEAPPPALAEPEPPLPAPEAPPSSRPGRSKGAVVLAIGLPGSGKSTWFKRHRAVPLSSDVIRAMLFDDVTEQRFQDLVFSTLRSLLRARLVARMPLNYVDATNLSPHDRRGWIKMAHDFGYEVQAVFFDVPVEVCMERNRRRNRVVPDEVMQRMAGKLRPPKFEEGFSKITVVRVKRSAEDSGEPEEIGG
jgi:predicted kinase